VPRIGWGVRLCVAAGASLALGQGRAGAQGLQFLPELDAHLTLASKLRTYVQVKDDRDTGASTQVAIGPSMQLHLKPLVKLKHLTMFDLDDTKNRVLVFEAGYRYLTGPSISPYSRIETIVTLNFPLAMGFVVTDRNRADLDWKSSGFVWRYRNKVTIERTVGIFSHHVIPYVAAEPFYESQYQRWATIALYTGCLLPMGRHAVFNLYYEHQNNTGTSPNIQQNSVGLALNLYFTLGER
jgi:hypothetical protein